MTIPLTVTPDIEKTPWHDCVPTAQTNGLGALTRIGRIPNGTTCGKSVVAVLIEMPDGSKFVAQTTTALFLAAARALKAVEEEASGSNANN